MLSGGLCCQILDLLSIKSSRSAVVFGVGRTGVTPVLTEKGVLREKTTTRSHHRTIHTHQKHVSLMLAFGYF